MTYLTYSFVRSDTLKATQMKLKFDMILLLVYSPILLKTFLAAHLDNRLVFISQSQIGLKMRAPHSIAKYGAADIRLF